MAGQPRKRAVIDELERRAVHDGCTVLEYAVDWLEGGGTLFSLARSIQRRLWPDELKDKRHPPAGIVEKHLKSLTTAEGETGAQVLSRARSSGSARGIEEALEIADDATEDDVQVARLRVGHRQWIAERLAPEFKQQKGTNVLSQSRLRMRKWLTRKGIARRSSDSEDYVNLPVPRGGRRARGGVA